MKLENTLKLFDYYRTLGSKCIDRLSFEELQWQPNAASNSVAIMVKHLWGNMLSRWTDFLTSDGEKEWRERDEEFEDRYQSKEDVLKHYNEGWDCLFAAIKPLSEEQLGETVYIRNEGHTVAEAIDRQMAHYAYHIGQIVFLSKQILAENWESLSIPKNQSKQYNAEKFKDQKGNRHFTDKV